MRKGRPGTYQQDSAPKQFRLKILLNCYVILNSNMEINACKFRRRLIYLKNMALPTDANNTKHRSLTTEVFLRNLGAKRIFVLTIIKKQLKYLGLIMRKEDLKNITLT